MADHLHEPLPLIPEQLQRRHQVHEPLDSRFRAAARLQQALWREAQGLDLGSYRKGTTKRRLGSRLGAQATKAGANFMDPAIAYMVRRELAYREPGAMLDEHRVWTNLLSSTPLAFNLFGPLKLNRQFAEAFIEEILPAAAGAVCHVQFEHSPGRGDPNFTDDGTAFDVFITVRLTDGTRHFIGIEVKFSESMMEGALRPRPRYDEFSAASGLFIDPSAPALRSKPLEQLWRLHMLAQSLVTNGLYDSGSFLLVAPAANSDVQRASRLYSAHLNAGSDDVTFVPVTLERCIDATAAVGWPGADAIRQRYCDFGGVRQAVDRFLMEM